MSYILDYRKKVQEKARAEQQLLKANAGFVTMPVEADTDIARNPRRVSLALIIAAGLLAMLNSAGLVNYAYNQADSRAGQVLVDVTEEWHALMEQTHTTHVVDHVRGSVATLREARWQDLKVALTILPLGRDDAASDEPATMPSTAPEQPVQPKTWRPDQPQKQDGSAPVMRASVE